MILNLLLFSILFVIPTTLAVSNPFLWVPHNADDAKAIPVAMVLLPGSSYAQESQSEYAEFIERLQSHFADARSPHPIALWVTLPNMTAQQQQPHSDVLNGALAALRQERRRAVSVGKSQRPFLSAPDFDLVVYTAHEDGKKILDDTSFALSGPHIKIYLASSPIRTPTESRDLGPTDRDNPWPPTLTVLGELDGVRRLFRYASDAFQMRNHSSMYYAVVQDANHHLVTSSSPWASWDIPAKISSANVQQKVVEAVADFIIAHAINESNSIVHERLLYRHKFALAYFTPIWKALLLESSYALLPPCHIYDNRNPGEVKRMCFVGSPWAALIQRRIVLGRIPLLSEHLNKDAQVMDELHFTWSIFPIHHPYIENTCTQGDNCLVRIHTVTQNEYTLSLTAGDPFAPVKSADSPMASYLELPVSAVKITAKQKSRQAFERAAGNKSAPLDGGMRRCASQNEMAWQFVLRLFGLQPIKDVEPGFWEHVEDSLEALQKKWIPAHLTAPQDLQEQVKLRFQQRVMTVPEMVMDDDTKPIFNVFTWIFDDLQWTLDRDQRRLVVKSPISIFSERFPLKFSSGMHFCKLLSPARALEWVMIDGLRM